MKIKWNTVILNILLMLLDLNTHRHRFFENSQIRQRNLIYYTILYNISSMDHVWRYLPAEEQNDNTNPTRQHILTISFCFHYLVLLHVHLVSRIVTFSAEVKGHAPQRFSNKLKAVWNVYCIICLDFMQIKYRDYALS